MIFDRDAFASDILAKVKKEGIKHCNAHKMMGISFAQYMKIVKLRFNHLNMYTFLNIMDWLQTDPKKYFI